MNFEELNIDLGNEMVEVPKHTRDRRFPTITINAKYGRAFFSRSVENNIPAFIKWFLTKDYVVILPAKQTDENAYTISDSMTAGKSTTVPSFITKQNTIASGTYKLLKYKDGFAFRRYSPIEEEA